MAVKKIYPLSPLQEGMLFHSLIENDPLLYFEELCLSLRGDFRIREFEKCLNGVIDRYDVLRTSFVHEKIRVPRQVVLDHRPIKIDFQDFRGMDGESQKEKIQQYRDANKERGFDLTRDPLLRVGILQTSDSDYIMVWTYHHIILDGWAQGIIVGELLDSYIAELQGKPLHLPAPIPYQNYINWLSKQDVPSSREFWKAYLEGYTRPTGFPQAAAKPSDFVQEVCSLTFPPALQAKFEQLARDLQVTVSTLFQCVWALMLQGYNQTDDVCFGLVVSGRPNGLEHVEKIVGLFINTVPVRMRSKADQSFADFVSEVRKSLIQRAPHEYLQLAEVQNMTEAGKELLDHILVIENYPIETREDDAGDGGLGFSVHGAEIFEQTNYPFAVNISLSPVLGFRITYNALLFPTELVSNIAKGFQYLAEQVIAHPEGKTSSFTLLDDTNRKLLVDKHGKAPSDFPREATVQQLFEEVVEKHPEHEALVFKDKVLNYHSLNQQANRLAHFMKSDLGLGPGSIVALLLDRSEAPVIAMLATLKTGAAYLPIDPDFPEERIQLLLEDTQAAAVITQSEHLFSLEAYSGGLFAMDLQLDFLDTSAENPPPQNNPEGLAYIMYTSGSTGRPKGVMIPHRAIVRLVRNTNFIDFGPSDTSLSLSSFTFDGSVFDLYAPLLNGGTCVISPKHLALDFDQLTSLVRERNASHAFITTALFNALVSHSPGFFQSMKKVLFGGERVSVHHVQEFLSMDLSCDLVHVYGPTENTTFSTWLSVKSLPEGATTVPIGRPISNTETYVLDAQGQLAPMGVEGELCLGGFGLAKGYWGDERLSAEKFVSHPLGGEMGLYKTGDIVRMMPGGMIEFVGRVDEQVKVRGYRIELGEIERKMLAQDGIETVAVVVRKDHAEENRLVAYYASSDAVGGEQIRGRLQSSLPDYMIPSQFVALEELPLNKNGKVDKSALPNPWDLDTAPTENYTAPRSQLEHKLAALWGDLLGQEKVGVYDNYFVLGGDSIKAIRLVSIINKELETKLEVKALFSHQNIAELATHMESDADQDGVPTREEAEATVKQLCEQFAASPFAQSLSMDAWESYFPMSDIQYGMIFHYLLHEGEGVFHDQLFHEFNFKDFDEGLFRKAMDLMVEKHEIFRTGFLPKGFDLPLQFVQKNSEFSYDLPVTSLVHLSEEAQRDHLKEVVRTDRLEGFELGKAGWWRASLFQLGEDRYVLLRSFSHAILDGWSDASFINELTKTYLALQSDPRYKARSLAASQYDFIVDQYRYKSSDAVKEFWQTHLEGHHRCPLPLSADRPSKADARAKVHHSYFLDESLSEGLKSLAQAKQVSEKEIYLAGFLALLHAATRSNDLLIGLLSHARPGIEDGDKLLGCFLNSWPFRVQSDGDSSGDQWISMVSDTYRKAMPYEKLSLFDISRIANRDQGRESPFFDILFGYLDFHLFGESQSGVSTGDLSELGFARTNTLLDIVVIREANRVGISLVGSSDHYEQKTLERMSGYLAAVLGSFCETPSLPIQPHQLIGEAERTWLQSHASGPKLDLPSPRTLHGKFESIVQETPDAIAVVDHGEAISYRKLNEKANQMAHFLRKKGVKADSVSCVLTGRSLDKVVAMLGILKAGGAFLCLDPGYPQQRLVQMVERSEALYVIGSGQDEALALAPGKWIDYSQPDIWTESVENPAPASGSGDLAYLIFTSGSTGTPKAVMVEHRAIVNSVAGVTRPFHLSPSSRVLQFSSPSFDAAVLEHFMTLLNGAALVLEDELDLHHPAAFETTLARRAVTNVILPPAFISLLELDNLPDLHCIISAGEAARERDALRIAAKCHFVNGFGPTECAVCTSAHQFNSQDDHAEGIPIGKPVLNMDYMILGPKQEFLLPGTPGELCVSGPGLARGYFGDAETTAAKYLPHPNRPGERIYRMGDLARWQENGNLQFLGRVDRQVKIRGFRIEPGEVEHRLRSFPHIVDAAILPLKGKSKQAWLCAWLVSTEALDLKRIRSFLKEELPEHMVPARFIQIDEIPVTPSGKVDWKALPRPQEGIDSLSTPYVAPRDEGEILLASIFAELLERDKVGIHDNFFELGGHSLLLVQLLHRLEHEAGIKIPMYRFFQYPTIFDLSAFKENARGIESLEYVDLDAFGILPEDVQASTQAPTTQQAVLLTGATGFVGAFVLQELLKSTESPIYCLVRASDEAQGLQRIKECLTGYDLWEDGHAARLRVLPSDLAQPRLALKQQDWDRLAADVKAIYHVGAAVNFTESFSQAKPANVDGTVELLRLATTGHAMDFHFISTASIFTDIHQEYHEESAITSQVHSMLGGYAASKWVAERIVMEAGKRGIPAGIFRLGRITGHSESGACKPDDFFHRLLIGCMLVGSYPQVFDQLQFELTPVDFVARAIVRLSQASDTKQGIWHLLNPHKVEFRFLTEQMKHTVGVGLRKLAYSEWLEEVEAYNKGHLDSPFYRVMPILHQVNPEEGTGIHQHHIACTQTTQALEAKDVHCPKVDERLLKTYYSNFLQKGYVKLLDHKNS